jgi:hypothetical protein
VVVVAVDEAEAAHSAETDPGPSRTNEVCRHYITKNPCPEIVRQEPDPIPDTGTCNKNIDIKKKNKSATSFFFFFKLNLFDV